MVSGKAGEKGLKVIGRGDKAREGMLRWRVGGWLGRALKKEIFVLKKSLGKVLNFGSKNLYEPWDDMCKLSGV